MASNMKVWAEYLQAKAQEEDLKERAEEAHSDFETFFAERLGSISELIEKEQELRRKVAFFEELSKFKKSMLSEAALDENTGFGDGLDENCIATIRKKAEEVTASVVVKNVTHAEGEDAQHCIEELAKSGKLLESSAGFEYAKLYTEAQLVAMACKKEQSSISALLKASGNAARDLECIELLKKKGYIPVRDEEADCGDNDTSGFSSLDACNGSAGTSDSV
ncbi:uncharacterized protein LOC144133241 isoform X1 [Amblyomma americanum]